MEVIGLIPNQWYCITVSEACTITAKDYTGFTQTLKECSKAGQYMVKTISDKLTIDDDSHALVEGPFKVAPAPDNGDGGDIESDLNVGHGASTAVAAVCTLTLGDLATGGTLTDSNGQSVELANPHKYAEGWVGMLDATEAGTIAFGEHEAIEFEEKKGIKASGTFYTDGQEGTISVINGDNEYSVAIPENYDSSVEEWNAAFTAAGCGLVCTALDAHGEVDVSVEAETAGEAGNGIVIAVDGMEPVTLEGGQDARTTQEVVDALNASENCPAVATLDADEGGIGFTAKEYGVNDTIAVSGSLFSNAIGMSDGHGDYTVAELVTAISGEFSDITPAAGEAEGTITLTATTAGKAANAITYTATGCFGSGITRQGSTTRGKDAVEQTDYKIYLNGEEFSGGGAPAAPVPEPLGTTTTLKHGHVYTLAVAEDADLSALGVELYGTAELWIDYTAGSVTWPTGLWWAEGSAPTLAAGKSYAIALRKDGVKLRANVQYEDTTPAQS